MTDSAGQKGNIVLLSGHIGKGVVTGNTRSWRSLVLVSGAENVEIFSLVVNVLSIVFKRPST